MNISEKFLFLVIFFLFYLSFASLSKKYEECRKPKGKIGEIACKDEILFKCSRNEKRSSWKSLGKPCSNVTAENVSASNLVILSKTRSKDFCCDGMHIKSCFKAKVNLSILKTREKISFNGVILSFRSMISPTGYIYSNEEGDEGVISYREETGVLAGSIRLGARSFFIEKCAMGYALIEYDMKTFQDEEPNMKENTVIQVKELIQFNTSNIHTNFGTFKQPKNNVPRRGRKTRVSIMVYYTPEFSKATQNIGEFVDNMIDLTNTGFENSGISLEVTTHCIAEFPRPIQDADTPTEQLDEMKRYNVKSLLNTADVAVLLTNKWRQSTKCGKAADVYTVESGENFFVVKKSCVSSSKLSFGHELGHLFGAGHDKEFKSPEVYINTNFPPCSSWCSRCYKKYHDLGDIRCDRRCSGQCIAHGYLFKRGVSKLRTIMAYDSKNDPGYTRINRYSSASRYGTSKNNNAKAITDSKYKMSKWGDESGGCYEGCQLWARHAMHCSGRRLTCDKRTTIYTSSYDFSSLEGCARKCVDDMQCTGWTISKGRRRHSCCLVYHDSETRLCYKKNAIAGLRCTYPCNIDNFCSNPINK